MARIPRSREPITADWHDCAKFPEIRAFLEGTRLLTARRAEQLAYEIQELLAICRSLPGRIGVFTRALGTAQEDGRALWEALHDLYGEMEHIRHHASGTKRELNTLFKKARRLPPLCDLSDDELYERAFRELDDKTDQLIRRAQQHGPRSSTPTRTKGSKRGK